jgi:feruloyl esterase
LWSLIIGGPRPFVVADLVTRITLFNDPNYDFRTFDFDAHTDLMFERLGPIWNATHPDLRRAQRNGTKIILWHGWNDWGIPPGNTVSYYKRVKAFIDSHRGNADDFMRLFMLPGVGHCSGGPGTDQFDGLGALERWVERGVAPEKIIASHLTNGQVDKTRPLCPYPKEAIYKGGDPNSAASFYCGKRR